MGALDFGEGDGERKMEEALKKTLTKQIVLVLLLFVAKNVSLYILSCRIMWSESRKSF